MGDRDYPAVDLFEAVDLMSKAAVAGVNVALPGRVESYDSALQAADVKPLVKAKTREGEAVSLPVLPNVPVLWPTFGGFVVIGPLDVGDVVQLVFNDRSIDRWQAGDGQEVEPASSRRHNVADAVAYPGLRPNGQPRTLPASAGADSLYIGGSGYADGSTSELTRVEITSDAKLLLGDGDVDVINALYSAINAVKTSTFGGSPMDPASIASLEVILTALEGIKP